MIESVVPKTTIKASEVERVYYDNIGITGPYNVVDGEPPQRQLQDSGERREFDSGAVRDISVGKGRCDLLPLDVVARIMDGDPVVGHIAAYMETGNTAEIESAIRRFVIEEELPFAGTTELMADAMLDVSVHFERGANKYAERNWEAGIPVHCYIDSGLRHYFKTLRGDDDEPHDVAFIWNMVCLIWTHHHRPECIDVDFKEVG